MFREIFHKVSDSSISYLSNEARVYLLWYVCSRGPFPLFLLGVPCSSIFPSAAYRHRAVPASPWLARLAATGATSMQLQSRMQMAGAQCLVDTGHIGYVSLYFASPHPLSVNSPALLDVSSGPAAAVAGGSRWVVNELLIGNERWNLPPLRPRLFCAAGSRMGGCTER
jgi:hypothetical protein